MSSTFQICIAGSGYGLNVLLPAFAAVPAFQVTALYGRDAAKLRKAGSSFNIKKIYTNWQQLLNDREIDVVALALPPFLQGKLAAELMESGKHLFCEKPLAASLHDAVVIAETAAKTNRRVMVDFGFRFVEVFGKFRELIRSCPLGAIQSVEVQWLLSTRKDPSLTWNWKSDPSQGGGTLFLMGSHVLDYLAWFFGPAQKIQAQLETHVAARPDESGRPKPVLSDDTCKLQLLLKENVKINVHISTVMPHSEGHRIQVRCEKGMMELFNKPGDDYFDGFQISVEGGKNPVDAQRGLDRKMIVQKIIESFAESLKAGKAPTPALEEGLYVQLCLEEARKSSCCS